MGWDFKDKRTALRLSEMASEASAGGSIEIGSRRSRNRTVQSILVVTPSGGIPARSEITSTETDRDEYELGFADCVLLTTYDPSGGNGPRDQEECRTVRKPTSESAVEYNSGTPDDWKEQTTDVTVCNPYPSAIDGNTIVVAHSIDGTYVVGAVSQSMLMKTAVGGIPARVGTAAGSASTVKACYINSSGTIVEVATPTLTVYNPFGTAVAGDTYITAKVSGGVLIIDAEDCP